MSENHEVLVECDSCELLCHYDMIEVLWLDCRDTPLRLGGTCQNCRSKGLGPDFKEKE